MCVGWGGRGSCVLAGTLGGRDTFIALACYERGGRGSVSESEQETSIYGVRDGSDGIFVFVINLKLA